MRGHQDFAAQVAALLGRRQLILEVDASGARLDHGLHQLEGVQGAAEASFRVGDERSKPVDAVLALGVMDLVGPHQGIVQPATQVGYGVGRVEALVRIHLPGIVSVGRDLPAAHVDRLQTSRDHLHCLVAAHGSQGVDIAVGIQHFPQAFCAQVGEGVFDSKRAAQAYNVFRSIRALNSFPARIGLPGFCEVRRGCVRRHIRDLLSTASV